MSNDIKKPEVNYFEQYGQAATTRNIVGSLLKFTKYGEYKAGQQNVTVSFGTKLVVHMPTLTVGWIKWAEGHPVDHVMGLISDGYKPPSRSKLGDTDKTLWEVGDDENDNEPRDPWQLSNYLIMSDPKDDQLYTFAASSKGGLSAIGELSKEYGKRIRQVPDEYPVIELHVGSYQHSNPRFGEIRFPIFKLVGWVPAAKYAALTANTPAQPAPKRTPPRRQIEAPKQAKQTKQASPAKQASTTTTTKKKPKAAIGF